MSRSPHVLSIVLGIAMVATSGSAIAGKSASTAEPHAVTRLSAPVIIGVPATALDPSCTAGSTLPPEDSWDIIEPDQTYPDIYITRIDPSTCSCGPNGQLRVSQVQMTLYSQYASCQMPVDIYFYGTKGAAGCQQAPDEAHVLAHFGPINFAITQAPTPGMATPYVFNLPSTVDLPHVAFVGVSFTTWGGCNIDLSGQGFGPFVNPELVYGDTTQCLPCQSFNYYLDSGGWTRIDFCNHNNTPSNFKVGNVLLSASGTCGNFVPTLPATWGQLKIRYNSPRRRRRRVTVRRPRPARGAPPAPPRRSPLPTSA